MVTGGSQENSSGSSSGLYITRPYRFGVMKNFLDRFGFLDAHNRKLEAHGYLPMRISRGTSTQ